MSRNFVVTVNGNSYEVTVDEIGGENVVTKTAPVKAAPKTPAAPQAKPQASAGAGSKKISAPMPGNVVKVNVTPGAKITKGQVVMVLEAMKMENEITAPEDGTIASVSVQVGNTVDTGAVLVTFD